MRSLLLSASLLCCLASNISADPDVHLHVNTRWKECSFQIDPSLTQADWHQFTREAGLVTFFRPVSDARPLGTHNYEFSIQQWTTSIDETAPAWNNTFVHPHDTHWLVGGTSLPFLGMMLRSGINRNMDLNLYWTVRPGANYGVFGGQVQWNLLNDTTHHWALSSRLGFNHLYGPADLTFTVYGADLLAGRTIRLFRPWVSVTPYAGISTYLSHSHERTDVVALNDESIFGVRGLAGATIQLSMIRVGVEYNVSDVNSLNFKLGAVLHLGKSKN